MACRILAPQPGIKPGPPAIAAQSPNHWTTREFPPFYYSFYNFLKIHLFIYFIFSSAGIFIAAWVFSAL